MQEILNQIELDFAPQMTDIQNQIEALNVTYSELQAMKQQKINSVKDYYTALEDKARAEIIIASADPVLKTQVLNVTKIVK